VSAYFIGGRGRTEQLTVLLAQVFESCTMASIAHHGELREGTPLSNSQRAAVRAKLLKRAKANLTKAFDQYVKAIKEVKP